MAKTADPMTNSLLFSELTLRDVRIKNRIIASPMWQYKGESGYPTDWHVMNLGRLADGGAGLVFQEGTSVERRGCGTMGDLGLWDDAFVAPLQRIVSIIRDNGAVPGIQLMHCGRKARQRFPWEGRGALDRPANVQDWDEWDVIGPSAIPQAEGYQVPRPMSLTDVQDVTNAWITAAERASRIGYDVMEIHAAHGYLLHQFLSEASNVRTDRYGGSFENRIRLLVEVCEGIRSVWPQDKPLFVRLSCVDESGWAIGDSVALTKVLMQAGVDVIDCTTGGIGGGSPLDFRTPDYGYQVEFAAHIRRETGIRTAAVGLIVHADQAERILAIGEADLVAIARELMHNPNWPIDAAQKLGIDIPFSAASPKLGFWLHKRAASIPGFTPSTFGIKK
jgi:2,4-dienoyl-CoA reductase-like NADH-dependent reductase (Old Yellow Enzyme family)